MKTISPQQYLEGKKSEILFELTRELGGSEEKAIEVYDFMQNLLKGLKPLRCSKSQTEAYIEKAFREFPF